MGHGAHESLSAKFYQVINNSLKIKVGWVMNGSAGLRNCQVLKKKNQIHCNKSYLFFT